MERLLHTQCKLPKSSSSAKVYAPSSVNHRRKERPPNNPAANDMVLRAVDTPLATLISIRRGHGIDIAGNSPRPRTIGRHASNYYIHTACIRRDRNTVGTRTRAFFPIRTAPFLAWMSSPWGCKARRSLERPGVAPRK